MNQQKKVVVEIYPDGSSKVDAQNFNGVGCAKATEAIELALAGSDPGNRDDKKKPEFYQTTGVGNMNRA